ncbi:unnamed protein product [Cylicocyclus nassatus]|uniref:C-type lectin domain-containing protein n=1 Tax=Cylicocyclus nassatus TaxID=53992 RepID=A0AA36DJS3_CYLNA|nr:unnamed protein product [Cylicocyclus nassatus]
MMLFEVFIFITVISIKVSSDDGGWKKYKDHSYKAFDGQLNFCKAEEECNKMNANLASIHSDGEENFIVDLLKKLKTKQKIAWIGMYRKPGTKWGWTDDTKIDYNLWNQGEPNNLLHKEYCVWMFTGTHKVGKWNDDLCRIKGNYVCKK